MNVPFDHTSLPVDTLQLESPAPKSDERVSPPVDDALVKKSDVAVALVVVRLVIVPDAPVRSAIVPLLIVVVARRDVPVAVRVPVVSAVDEALPSDDVPDTRVFTVAVLDTVRLVKNAVMPFRSVAKKVDDVALVSVDDADVSSVVEAFVAESVVILVVASVDVPVTVRLAIVVVARVTVPVA